jgi:uncharacterized protein (DUF1800 family)
MALRDRLIEHLLRRAGFGGSPQEVDFYGELGFAASVERFVSYEQVQDTGLLNMNQPGYANVSGPDFRPNTNIDHARQRWLFRFVNSSRPLQDKMTMFLHDLFSTSYVKISGMYGGETATRMMAALPADDAGGMRGQVEMLRDTALGNYRDLLILIAQDPAMLVWLDGETNKKAKPQENFAREVMELFTIGRPEHTEEDVYAGARVFTGWNMRRVGESNSPSRRYEFYYNPTEHDTAEKVFSFPIYADGGMTIPARSDVAGYQDGIDFLNALAAHPRTGPRLATRMWYYFVSEVNPPTPSYMTRVSTVYYQSGYSLRHMLLEVLTSPEFRDPTNYFTKYSWPVEFVVRALKEVGSGGFPLSNAVSAMDGMDQELFAPPSVGGWLTGPGWFSTGAMIARMNFAATLTSRVRNSLRDSVRPHRQSPQRLLAHCLDRLTPAPFESGPHRELLKYLAANTTWTASDSELATKAAGIAHLLLGSSEYQLV